jgi:hypothetical protein
VTAASQKPIGSQRANYSKAEVLKDAVALGVVADDQAALLALAKVASERPEFHTTVVVHTADGSETHFDVLCTDDGPVARIAGSQPAPTRAQVRPVTDTTGIDEADESQEDDEVEIVPVLTNTMVDTPDLVAVFAAVGHEALWANDAFVTLVPIRQADKMWPNGRRATTRSRSSPPS